MQLRYGPKQFPVDGTDVGVFVSPILDGFGNPIRRLMRLDVSGRFHVTSTADATAQEIALHNALALPYQDLTLFDDGGAATAIRLQNGTSISGVRIVSGPTFANGTGPEYATIRTFAFSAEAEYMISGTEGRTISWQESVSIQGDGGPLRTYRLAVNGPILPQPQIVYPRTTVSAVQSGQAVGHTGWPAPANPIWPAFLITRNSGVTRIAPRRVGNGSRLIEYPIAWSYQFESPTQLVGLPTLPPQ